jgi:hypothetical protein
MTVENHTQFSSDAMARRRLTSPQATDPQTVARMKARQSAKIRDIANVLVASGFHSLDAQARILGIGRSTAWTILKSNHKGSGLSAKLLGRILSAQQLPPLVRKTIVEYVEEKASGRYGHSAKVRRKFITALTAKVTIVKDAAGPTDRELRNYVSAAKYTRPKSRAKGSKRVPKVRIRSDLQRPRRAGM